ncbi:hypothetical protein [Haladaptatus pallidirubidus]|nr:hypothetical protein [Haladaptatus pallidirubidus]
MTDLYAAWLEDSFDVRRAHEGHEALDLLDNEVSVVPFDRRPAFPATKYSRSSATASCAPVL